MASPAAANGPIDMNFGMGVDIDDRMPIFGKSGSKVKSQGQKSAKTVFFSDF